MSEILGINGRPVRRKPKSGHDLATVNEATNIAANMAGPIAIWLREVATRLQVVEDQLGIVAPMASPLSAGYEPPPNTAEGGDL